MNIILISCFFLNMCFCAKNRKQQANRNPASAMQRSAQSAVVVAAPATLGIYQQAFLNSRMPALLEQLHGIDFQRVESYIPRVLAYPAGLSLAEFSSRPPVSIFINDPEDFAYLYRHYQAHHNMQRLPSSSKMN